MTLERRYKMLLFAIIVSFFGFILVLAFIVELGLLDKNIEDYTVLDIIAIIIMLTLFIIPSLFFTILYGTLGLAFIIWEKIQDKVKPYLEHKPFERKE